MPKPYPPEFRCDIVAVARKHEAPLNQIVKDFGISKSSLANWLKKVDVEEGVKPGVTEKESAELRDAKKRIRLLEQEAEVMRRAVAYLSREVNPNLPGIALLHTSVPPTEAQPHLPARLERRPPHQRRLGYPPRRPRV
ncbi:Transposase [Cryobacterium luteum]|nr:Transposase [Cryobacterium luteum]